MSRSIRMEAPLFRKSDDKSFVFVLADFLTVIAPASRTARDTPKLGGVARRRFISRAGVVSKPLLAKVFRREPPRLRQLWWLRAIFLMAQPPLLT
jgi:hypothetical protein